MLKIISIYIGSQILNRFKIFFPVFIIMLCLQSGLADPGQKQSYNLGQPQKIVLKKSLDEISGMVYDDKTNCIVAINDEKGKIYTVDPKNTKDHMSSRFAENGDFEDIVKVGNKYYVLRSDGTLFEVADIAIDTESKKYKFPTDKNEFEGLYFDQSSNQLRLLCKSCEGDKSSKEVSVYAFDLKTGKFLADPVMFVDVKTLSAKLNVEKTHFKPSAIAIHPVEKKLYILSSVNKLLIKTDLKGKTEEVWTLDPVLFKQPEGIAFSKSGDMYISNEAAGGKATILVFKYSSK